jgi:hypothetical protein
MAEENGSGTNGYVLFVWSPAGYSLRELEGEPPRVGDELDDGGRTLVVTRHGPSPFPADPRRCAFTAGR